MNPIAFSLGPFEIRWYALFILSGFLIGMLLIKKEAKRLSIEIAKIMDLCFYLIIVSIIGARIYYVIFEFDSYKNNLLDIFAIWQGGLAIHGGIIAGIIFTYFYCKKKNLCLLQITDLIAPSLILGQAIGRWGNFFNGEAFGPKTTYMFLKNLHLPKFIIDGMYLYSPVDNIYAYRHPTFLYESLWCLIGFILLILLRRNKKIKIGQITGIYFIIYGIERFFVESLRQDSLMMFNLKVAQLISIVMIMTGIFLFIYSIKKSKKYN
ncbi:MAG: prolipoprotein diacylglyceryl transferase [Bacilli bacterium]|nr:prolipoprotein diacylglyceryl transferase [Bacilli bacterium]